MRPLPADELRLLLELEVRSPLRRLQGRETFEHRARDGRAIIVKRSRPGARPGGRREHDALLFLAEIGLSVPAALGFVAGPAGSLVALAKVEHSETARERLARAPAAARRALLARIAGLLARLHTAGARHRDFYAHHLLLRADDEQLVLIDAGRAGPAPFPRWRWFVKDAGALLSSLPPAASRGERLRFLRDYLDARQVRDRGARRRFARAALAKAGRIAARVPRDERAPTAAGR
ncbi:MAG: phosphotransferase [Planctomycetes bacterium]|nr:phosphotransferase [Planctomycetota bacterium]